MTTNEIQEYVNAWENDGWGVQDYDAFARLAKMFPAPCQELYVLDIREGMTKMLCFIRPESDELYAEQLHNPGTAERSTDGVVFTATRCPSSMRTVSEKVLEQESEKITWMMTSRQKALFRVMTGKEIGFTEEHAVKMLDRVHIAGDAEEVWTPRGHETARLNVLLLYPEEVESITMRENMVWVDVTKIFNMGERDEFMQHQVNRIAKAILWVRENMNPRVPVLRFR